MNQPTIWTSKRWKLLEEMIDSYQGTVLLVSHDRQFVDNSVTECWIFEGNGVIDTYVGGYYDAHHQRATAKPIRTVATSQTQGSSGRKKPSSLRNQQPN
ncbi:ABC transporter ATPase component [Serratia fonticola]|uniref:ABC transporter ATPase component n=1 Tax=Serratia fonticola TaxID=47917 RepID=A0A4U9V7S6_SERFO|nr:ABC transporter ATPase component [Serratia fonticola]